MKKVISLVLVFIFLVNINVLAVEVKENHWSYPSVSFLSDKEIIPKEDLSQFKTEKVLTIKHFIKYLSLLSGEKPEDLSKWALDNKIILEGEKTDEELNRLEMAKLVRRFLKFKDYKIESNQGVTDFTDVEYLSDAEKNDLRDLKKLEIIKGKKSGIFDPKAKAKNTEIAVILKNTYDVLNPKTEDSKWYDKLPRASWAKYPQVEVKNDWFEVHKMPGDVYAIYEPGQWEEVISFLILGKDKAILWDTGLGIGNIKDLVSELTKLPVTVVNSHTHFDHIGGNALFDEIMVFADPLAISNLEKGKTKEEVKSVVEGDAVWKKFPKEFDPKEYFIKGKAPTKTLNEGEVIDLGNRKLEVVHTPGHSMDSIMLIDETNGILFTGDTYYPAPLYAYSEGANLLTYADSMKKIVDKIKDKDIKYIYSSHNEVVEGTEVLGQVLKAMEEIKDGTKKDYELNEKGRRVYIFENNIKIITLDEDYFKN